MLDATREHGRIILFIGDKVHNLDPQDAIDFGDRVVQLAREELHFQVLAEARRRAIDPNTDFIGL